MIDNLKKKTDQTKAKNAIQLFIKIMHKTALCCDNVLLSGWKREIPLNKAIYQVKTENVPNKKMLLFEIYLGDKIELNCSLVAKLDGFINNRNYLSSFITLHSQEKQLIRRLCEQNVRGMKNVMKIDPILTFFFLFQACNLKMNWFLWSSNYYLGILLPKRILRYHLVCCELHDLLNLP